MPVTQRRLEWGVQLFGRDLALLQIQRHQRLVDLDDLIDQRPMCVGDGGEVRFACGIEKAIDHAPASVGGQIDRKAFFSERRLDRGERLFRIGVLRVDLVDDHQPTKLAFRCPGHHARGDHLDARLRIDDHRSGFHCIQGADRLTDEIRKAGGVDQVHTRGIGIEVQHRRAQRVLQRFLQRIEVADGGPALDAAGRGYRLGTGEQRLGERRLARSAVPDQRNGTNVLGGVLRHACSSSFRWIAFIVNKTAPAARSVAATRDLFRDSPKVQCEWSLDSGGRDGSRGVGRIGHRARKRRAPAIDVRGETKPSGIAARGLRRMERQ